MNEKQKELSILSKDEGSLQECHSSHNGAMLWLGGTSNLGSITCLNNTETKTQETRVLLNTACVTVILLLALVQLC